MSHNPRPVADGVPPYAVELAERGRDGRLVVYAGAGLSMAEPTGLPAGSKVAASLHGRLKGPFPGIDACDPTDLTAVADAVAAQAGGDEALRQTAPRIAEFTTATPGYGHRVLALLLLEGLADVMTTNWDDCIERGGGSERVASVVTEMDLLRIPSKSVLKIHGCARQPDSLLITSSDLDTPPDWVRDQTRARLGTSVVAFVGIGDVAGYVRRRVEEAIAGVGSIENIRVVGPGIVEDWNSSPWSGLAPGLEGQYRIPETADGFLEHVGSAYVHITLADIAGAVTDNPRLAAALSVADDSIRRHDALRILMWARAGAVNAEPGVATLKAPNLAAAILALGLLLTDGFRISREYLVEGSEGTFDVVFTMGVYTSSRLRREAENRLAMYLGLGLEPPTFLVAGGIGWAPADDTEPINIVGGGDANDVLDGPLNVRPVSLRAEDLVG